jgi:hypothetical protein
LIKPEKEEGLMKPIVLRDPEVNVDDPPIKVEIPPKKVPDAGGGKGPTPDPDKGLKVKTPEELAAEGDAGHVEHKPKGDANAAFAAMRVENKRLNDTVNQLQERVQKVDGVLQKIGQVYGNEEDPEIPIEERLVKDPIGTIKLISKAAYQEVTSEARFNDTLVTSRKAVLEKYPALRNPESPEYQVYNRLCAENPDYFKLAKGPLMVMRDMEDELKLTPAGKINPAEEHQFINVGGAPAGGVIMRGGGAGALGGGATELTPAQADYCRKFGIDPKIYLQVANKANKGGYTV